MAEGYLGLLFLLFLNFFILSEARSLQHIKTQLPLIPKTNPKLQTTQKLSSLNQYYSTFADAINPSQISSSTPPFCMNPPLTPLSPSNPLNPTPLTPSTPLTPLTPTPSTPLTPLTPLTPTPSTPLTPLTPLTPTPSTPLTPLTPLTPTPSTPLTPLTPSTPTPSTPLSPLTPLTPTPITQPLFPSPPPTITQSPPKSPQNIPPTPPTFAPGPPIFLPPIIYPPPLSPPNPKPKQDLWCVAKPAVPDPIIQEAMDYACGSGADCDPISAKGSCFEPDTVISHASYAFNSYWQDLKETGATCDFGGVAVLVTKDPSYDSCHFKFV